MSSLKKILDKLLPWLLIIVGFFFLDYFDGFIGGIAMICGLTILIDRILSPEISSNNN
jgi:hypothetical protein